MRSESEARSRNAVVDSICNGEKLSDVYKEDFCLDNEWSDATTQVGEGKVARVTFLGGGNRRRGVVVAGV